LFETLLIANRGEIACRVAATARRLGLRTVAVHSDADASARHVRACDEAHRVGPAPAGESYLRGEAVLEIARRCGARAIHPGYGFLSENADFAQACADAGIVFVGPPPSAIRAMGLKAESKRLMASAGVPLMPGYHGEDQDPLRLAAEARQIGFPVLIKASAGGGGKGMRIVHAASAFDDALASCRREAAASFGNDAVLLEKYASRPRHVEIQVFCDAHGGALYLFERDCSVQRRHQKVIEEAPAPGLPAATRRAMGEAALAAARAVGYVGAGTVEFILDASGAFYFMEMNTRLQVEHPVTEMITGLDLVEWQLRVAAGGRLPLEQTDLRANGHAIEARVYAENPDRGFLPSTGTLVHLRTPPASAFAVGTGADGRPAAVRIDSGVGEGDAITPYYDPMIAKLIVWGEDRAQAIARMREALTRFEVVGPSTNVDFLGRLMRCRAFVEADLDTALIERERDALGPRTAAPSAQALALAAAAVLTGEAVAAQTDPHEPWAVTDGWRVGAPLSRPLTFTQGETRHRVLVTYRRDGWVVQAAGASLTLAALRRDGTRLSGRVGGTHVEASVVLAGGTWHLFTATGWLALGDAAPLAHAGDDDADRVGGLVAPMPGKIIALMVEAGAAVQRGQPLLVMEAMKMEHTLAAPADGVVEALRYRVGDQVAEGAALVDFAPHRA
jgi:3-methylcrotonyl-CoA carboxylase alpha subunit